MNDARTHFSPHREYIRQGRDGADDQGRLRGHVGLRVALAAAVRVLQGRRTVRHVLRQANELSAGVFLRVSGGRRSFVNGAYAYSTNERA